ncbi:hypothetical protein MHPYR_180086 [uncultured Mycobacterium sp.]|uniref:Uncharacterized protein n=1 Tax=uncultured Mycobacterium sp. TaxID=171292 RepID=A0A1Y5P591_9MYCO|nr:hypothetical protein MHPYR_180086 [uncultured Mycobacterium sp.]
MPDRNLDENGFVALDPEPTRSHLDPQAIADCSLCDDQGYRGGVVCDHVDHAAESEHGRALARAELARIRERKAGAK